MGGLNLPEDLLADLVGALRAAAGRMLLIRRPGRAGRSPAVTRWFVLHHEASLPGRGRMATGSWETVADLRAAVDALADESAGEPVEEPMVLVCTHGVHDACCAIAGRPVAAALAKRWPQRVWECSHVGGDRFAANVIAAPTGVCFGGLDATSAVSVLADLDRGLISADHLRGHTTMGPVQQAAVGALLQRYGPAGVDDARVLERRVLEPGRWEVEIAGRGPLPERTMVELVAEKRPEAWLTCRAHMATSATVYRVADLRPGSAVRARLDG